MSLDDQAAQGTTADSGQPACALPLLPLEAFPVGNEPLSAVRQAQWIGGFLAVGVVLRLVRFLLKFPLWEDECLLSANYLDRGYLDLLRPLDYYQVCVPGFLWAQLTAVKLLGFTEYSLRLVPLVCGLGSLFLFRHVAGRLLRGTALVLAVGIFSVGYPLVRYSAEAKPYGCDLFFGLAMFALAIEWLRRPNEDRWLWWLCALTGLAVWCSYPAVFVGGGISAAVGYTLWREGRHGWTAWAMYNLVLVASFAGLMALSRTAVGDSTQARMAADWTAAFPPVAQPVKLLVWLISTHAGNMLAYPVGDKNGASAATLLCCLISVALLVRRRQGAVLLLFLVPLGINLLAAALHRYPYGGHVRMALYLGHVFCVLAALGATAAVGWLGRRSPNRPVAVLLTALLLLAGIQFCRDLSHPYKSTTTLRARDFARWFWFDMAQNSELVCLHTDWKEDVSPGSFDYGWSCLYVCNQRIYSPRHARGEPPDLGRVSASRPLRCVAFRSGELERDCRPLERWLANMQDRYQLVARDAYPFCAFDKWDNRSRGADTIEVFKFVPKGSLSVYNGSYCRDH
jgi:hypothetical protein